MVALASLVLYLQLLATLVLSPRDADCLRDFLSSQAILAANTAFERAVQASATATLSRLLAPDYLFVTTSGEVRDRHELLRSYGS